jgi:hypothetical protein
MTEVKEVPYQIAYRVPPGDNWQLCDINGKPSTDTPPIFGLVEVLSTYMRRTGYKGTYKLDPLGGKLYILKEVKVDIKPPTPDYSDFYGDGG